MSLERVEWEAVDTGADGVYPPRTPAQQVGEVGSTVGAGQHDLAVDAGRDFAFARAFDDADPGPIADLGRKRELAVVDDDGFRGVGHGTGPYPRRPPQGIGVRLGRTVMRV